MLIFARTDIAIAYLRRVHFVTFYGGRRYRDEAHLLAMAPSLTHRTYACTPTEEEERGKYWKINRKIG